jgi:phage terminase small subunit
MGKPLALRGPTSDSPLSAQEAVFVAGLARGMNDKAAMVAAGYAETTKPYLILRRPNVAAAVEKAKAEIRAESKYDTLAAMRELDAFIEKCDRDKNPSRMAQVRAVETKARLNGLLVEKIEVSHHDLGLDRIQALARCVDDVDILIRKLEALATVGRLSSEHYDRLAALLPVDVEAVADPFE